MKSAKLDKPMSRHDFEQMTLLANLIGICEIMIPREPSGSERRLALAKLLRDARRIESSIPGHLDGRSIDASKDFYNGLQVEVGKFLDAMGRGDW